MATKDTKKSKVRYFKVVAGEHEQNGKTFRAGTDNDIVKSRYDLAKTFANKFKEVDSPEDDEEDDDVPPVGGFNRRTDEVKSPKNHPKFGKNRTQNFEDVEAAELLIYRDEDKKYTVVDPQEPDTALNDEPLARSEVDTWLVKYLKKE